MVGQRNERDELWLVCVCVCVFIRHTIHASSTYITEGQRARRETENETGKG